jgi:hypothetical protein
MAWREHRPIGESAFIARGASAEFNEGGIGMATIPSTPDAVAPSRAPTNKAVAATGASAVGTYVATIVLYVSGWTSLPDNVQTAITALITAVVTMAAAYFILPGSGEAVTVTPQGKAVTGRRT